MKRLKQFYLSIIIICLIIIAWSTYYTLGGFDPLEVFVMEGKELTVIGKEYIEKYHPSEFDKKMRDMRDMIEADRLNGMLTVVFFQDENIGKDSVHYFIGASKEGIKDVMRLPADYTYKEFKTDKVFKVFRTQHVLVRPTPEKVEELIQVKAIEEGVALQPFSFELYYADGSFSVEYWAK